MGQNYLTTHDYNVYNALIQENMRKFIVGLKIKKEVCICETRGLKGPGFERINPSCRGI